MKKINRILIVLVIILLAFILMSTSSPSPSSGGVNITSEVIQMDGITYRVFKGKSSFDNYIDIEVVNVTKEKLEIQRLKAEIEYYKKIR